MKKEKVLSALHEGEIGIEDAYDRLYPLVDTKKLKWARFVKMSIHVPDESKKVNLLLKTLFAIPFPIGLINVAMRLADRYAGASVKKELNEQFGTEELGELLQLLRYAKGSAIDIDAADGTQVTIKIL